jgi:hypothetical protein
MMPALIDASTAGPATQVANAVRSGLATDLKRDWGIFILALVVIVAKKLAHHRKRRGRRRRDYQSRASFNRRFPRARVTVQPAYKTTRGTKLTPQTSLPSSTLTGSAPSIPSSTLTGPTPIGTAGFSSQQVFERWSRNGADSQPVRAWATGAEGERIVAGILDPLVRTDLRVIHDRQIPHFGGNIDHIVVGPSGVFVIDAKNYTDAKIITRRREDEMRLYVNGRDRTPLVEQLLQQTKAVRGALLKVPSGASVPIFPVLCFVGQTRAPWPSFEILGALVGSAAMLAEYVQRPGPCDAYWVQKFTDAIVFGCSSSQVTSCSHGDDVVCVMGPVDTVAFS